MTTPVIGTVVATGVAAQIDMQRLLVSRLLIQANSGAGKSWALRRILEQTHGQVPQVVLDVDEEFHTLREKFPYVLAGLAGADCRADLRTAPVLARRILEHGFSTIISIYELKSHERGAFVRLFLESLMSAKRALWRPLLVVVDEAHVFCPEKDKAESTGAVIDLMTRGRKRGYCGVLATQRISKLHKDAAAEANNKLIGRAALDLDMQRAATELGFSGREQQHQLRTLSPGRFFAFGPALSEVVVELQVGKVHTTHPEPGDRGTHAPPPAPAKLKAILEKIEDLPKVAEEEEDELARLRRALAQARAGRRYDETVDPGQMAAAIEQERTQGRAQGYQAAVGDLMPFRDRLRTLRDAIVEHADQALQDLDRWAKRQAVACPAVPPGATPARVVEFERPPVAPARKAASPHAGVTGPKQRILDALAWLESVGIGVANKVQLALLADASPKSSSYGNNLGALRSAGLIDYPSGRQVALTGTGRAAARSPASLPTTADLHRTLQDKLPAPQWRILEALIAAFPEPVDRGDLAGRAGAAPASSSYGNNLGALRSLGFIDYPVPGRVVALPVLFLDSRGVG